ncbi:MAG: RidA family protein [Silicimonas sp.]
MDIERILLDDQMAPVSHYCHSVRAGDLIWVSGIVGQTADGHIPEDTVQQFDIALAAMDACLRAAGGMPHTVTKVQVFLTDISERAAINPARVAYFGEHRPASTLVEVSALVDPRMKVEIECMAVVAKD